LDGSPGSPSSEPESIGEITSRVAGSCPAQCSGVITRVLTDVLVVGDENSWGAGPDSVSDQKGFVTIREFVVQ
jgi:hypothetical protein